MVKGCEILTPSASSLTSEPGGFVKALSLKLFKSSLKGGAVLPLVCGKFKGEVRAGGRVGEEGKIKNRSVIEMDRNSRNRQPQGHYTS